MFIKIVTGEKMSLNCVLFWHINLILFTIPGLEDSRFSINRDKKDKNHFVEFLK